MEDWHYIRKKMKWILGKNIKFTLFIYNIRVKGLLNKRLNCHIKSFTFSFLLPCTTFQLDKGEQRTFLDKDKEKISKDMSKQIKGQLSVDIRQVQEGSKSGIK